MRLARWPSLCSRLPADFPRTGISKQTWTSSLPIGIFNVREDVQRIRCLGETIVIHSAVFRAVASALLFVGLQCLSPAQAAGSDILLATLAETDAATPEVSTAEMRAVLAEKSGLVLDARSRAEFDAGHIPGALHLDAPGDQYVAAVINAVGGDKARAIVLYCNGPYCQASRRFAEQLSKAGFTNVRRYQLGMPVWRALGGPTQVEAAGIKRIFGKDRTAVFVDVRAKHEAVNGTLEGALNAPLQDLISGKLAKIPLPEDDFNRRIVIFGASGDQALRLAQILSTRPWHNVMFFAGGYGELEKAVRGIE